MSQIHLKKYVQASFEIEITYDELSNCFMEPIFFGEHSLDAVILSVFIIFYLSVLEHKLQKDE